MNLSSADSSSAAHELYGVSPGAFMETRKRLVQEAKAGGDAKLAKEIGALRRPTLSAWAVNLLSRSAGEELGWLLEVGEGLREAWASGGSIGGLEQRRSEVVALLVRRSRELAEEAGHPLRDPAVREVEDTLQAATVDADVAEEVRRGRLTQPRSHSGFVPAGFPMSVDDRPQERPEEPAPAGKAEPEPRRSRAAERAREKAEEAERDLEARAEEVSEAQDDMDAADAEAGRLRRELDKAVARQEAAAGRLEKAEHRRDKAAGAAERARRKAREAAGGG